MSPDPQFDPASPFDVGLITMHDPQHMVAALPYLLGFHPQRSLVAVGLNGDAHPAHVVMAARYDLDHDDVDYPATLAEHLWSAIVNQHAVTAVLLVVFSDEVGVAVGYQPHEALVARVEEYLFAKGVQIVDVLYTDTERVWVYGHEFADSPWHGQPVLAHVRDEVAANFVLAGRAPVANRAILVQESQFRPSSRADQLTELVPDLIQAPLTDPDRMLEACDAITDLLLHTGHLSVRQEAFIVAALMHLPVRDLVLFELVPASRSHRLSAIERLTQIAQDTPDIYAANSVTLLAILHWLIGDGARANVAIARARAAEPECSMAQLIETALLCGMPSEQFTNLFGGAVSKESCLGLASAPAHDNSDIQ